MRNKKRIVILGGGFGGAYSAQLLEKYFRKETAEIVLIDRNNYFIFYPLLAEAGTGSLEPRHAVVSIRKFLNNTIFRMAEVHSIRPEKREVYYQVKGKRNPETLHYDHLLISLGSVTSMPAIRGLHRYGFQLKSLADAVALRDRAIRLLELAEATPDPQKRRSLLHFVVVGSNFTGVEVAGEFDVFLKHASRYYKNIEPSDCKVTLIEITGRILPALDEDLSGYAEDHLRKRGINIRLHTTVSRVGASRITLNDDSQLFTRTVVWCAGIAPNPLISNLSLPTDKRGYILCENDFRVKGFDNLWAIGDCAVNPDPQGNPYPATAQHAVGEAKCAAKNIARAIRGQETVPCDLASKGALAALGCRTAVAKIFGIKLSGFIAWFLWRTVYLFKMPGWARRVRVALDWSMGLLFKRDYVQLGVHRTPNKNSAQRNGEKSKSKGRGSKKSYRPQRQKESVA